VIDGVTIDHAGHCIPIRYSGSSAKVLAVRFWE